MKHTAHDKQDPTQPARHEQARSTMTLGGLTALRVVVGIIFVAHGWLKLADMPAWQSQMESMGFPAVGVLSWLAMLAELGGGLLLILGLLTPLAALATAANMFVAVVWVHLGNGLLAQNNGFEFPLTLALVSLYFVFRGAGPVSLDAVMRKRRAARKESTRSTRERTVAREETEGRVRVHTPRRDPAHVSG